MFFSESDLRPHLHYSALIPAIRAALIDYSAGRVQQPPRNVLQVNPQPDNMNAACGWFATMPVVHGEFMAVKTVTFYPTNAALGLPTHLAIIELLNRATGQPLAVMDGRLITEMRTAAVSAVAFLALRRPAITTLGVLGAGVQARSHIEALITVWPELREIKIASRNPANAQKLAAELTSELAPHFPNLNILAATAESATNAQVLVAATSSPTPAVFARSLRPDALILSVGAVGSKLREMDDETMLTSTVIAESRDGIERESGDLILSGAKLFAELGDILSGRVAAPHTHHPAPANSGRILFKSVGMAIEDLVGAKVAWESLNRLPN